MNVEKPSIFWERLAAEHRREFEVHGLDGVKRRQALRYFNWRWRWKYLYKSEQFRFLLGHTAPPSWFRAAAGLDVSDQVWDDLGWGRPDRWLYCFAVRLLWLYAERHGDCDVLALPEPELGGPLPVSLRGRLISQDLANGALELAAIRRALKGRAPRSVLEVGAGYGRTAYILLNLFPDMTYTIVDIDPAIRISEAYLSALFPANRVRFWSPSEFADVDNESFDLVISISSLQEMTQEQVSWYLSRFDPLVPDGIVYLKQWRRWFNPADEVTLDIDSYPIPQQWSLIFKQACPVQTSFVQLAWATETSNHS